MGNKSTRLKVAVKPELLRWARERAGRTIDSLEKAFPKYKQWESGEAHPTLKQLERLAKMLHVPLGFLFLEATPEESLPIPDFRTMPAAAQRPSPDLLDTIYLCQQRQEWYRGYLQTLGAKALPFVGTADPDDNPIKIAAGIRRGLHLDLKERRNMSTWTAALRRFIEQAEAMGILVMSSSIVGNNPHRKLDPQEFRGFVLVDDLAPVIFINAADTTSAQMFTMAHELAHVWLGQSGVSDANVAVFPERGVERWCNQVAAELLVPMATFRRTYQPTEELRQELDRLARHFKVSTLVILRRIYEIEALSREAFWQAYQEELVHLRQFERRGEGGGDFYRTLNTRVSKSFAQAVVISALEGHTLFRDAYQMLGIRKAETLWEFAKVLGIR